MNQGLSLPLSAPVLLFKRIVSSSSWIWLKLIGDLTTALFDQLRGTIGFVIGFSCFPTTLLTGGVRNSARVKVPASLGDETAREGDGELNKLLFDFCTDGGESA